MKPRTSIFNNFPFVRFTAAFIAGIIIRNIFDKVPTIYLVPIILLIIITLLFFFRLKRSIRADRFLGISVFISFLGIGFIFTQFYLNGLFEKNIPLDATYTGIILDKAPSTSDRFKYTLKLDCVKKNDSLKSVDENIILYNSDSLSNAQLEPGKRVLFQSRLFEIINSNNPCEFNYKKFMKVKGIRYQTYIKGEIALTEYEHFNLKTSALNLRTKLMKMYQSAGIEGDEYSVLCALTLGDQNYISNEVKSSFSASGTTHVLSVSGLHVGIIFIIISLLLKPLDKSKRLKLLKILILLVFLWFYAFISGLSPPVLRSCSMFSFIVIGENLQRRTNTYNTLAVSAFVLLLINPLMVFDVGFQLSYMAVISIVFYQPKFSSLIKTKNIILKYLWGLITVSIAAQLGTTPVCIFYFHQFPTYFLISNLIAVPMAALILYAALPFYAFSFIPFLSKWLAFLLKYMTWFLNHSVQTIELLPGSVIKGLWISDFALILLYLLIICFSIFVILKKGIYLNISLSLIIILLGLNLKKQFSSYRQNLIIVYNNRTEPLISFIEGKKHYYFSTSTEIGNYSQQSLKNVSGFFKTSLAEKLDSSEQKNCEIDKEYLFYDGNLIKLENKFSKDHFTGVKFDLIYNLNEPSIKISENNKYKVLKRGIKESVNEINPIKPRIFNLKEEGALLLEIQ
jgi:competence protein ComEC